MENISLANIQETIAKHISELRGKYPEQLEFISAVDEQLSSLTPFFVKYPQYLSCLAFITEPETLYSFKVAWEDDKGVLRVNKGFRCHFNNAIGPYKGGLRFAPSVNPSIIKFLAFEQTFKNALTGLPMGGGKGGSDFNPKGKSASEIRRFCVAFAKQLFKIGIVLPEGRVDIPAGDIGVGGTEIGHIFGEFKRLTGAVPFASITGKPLELGGSLIRPEATGYGLVYILQFALLDNKDDIKEKNCAITGSGNVALFCAEKVLQLGGNVITVSDSNGVLTKKNSTTNTLESLTFSELEVIKEGKFNAKQRLTVIADMLNSNYKQAKFVVHQSKKVWEVLKEEKATLDILLPCATQNEVTLEGSKVLKELGLQYVAEGANMPTNNDAIDFFLKNIKLFIPAKASNAGGVAVSGLEMTQNGMRKKWSKEKVDKALQDIMQRIYSDIKDMSIELGDKGNLVLGANSVGFKRVIEALYKEGSLY
eukprot:GAHX01000234.1.p1 GENE.GAHX01000234.1~~GAHX01000234.1.p1  ORF type:complete len:479 (-),score=97.53 GAHX01000234.1:903-2339(-)